MYRNLRNFYRQLINVYTTGKEVTTTFSSTVSVSCRATSIDGQCSKRAAQVINDYYDACTYCKIIDICNQRKGENMNFTKQMTNIVYIPVNNYYFNIL